MQGSIAGEVVWGWRVLMVQVRGGWCLLLLLKPRCLWHDQTSQDMCREDDVSCERMQDDGGDPAAKRAKRPGQRYNDEQVRKLETYYMRRDQVEYDQIAAAVTGLDGGRFVES